MLHAVYDSTASVAGERLVLYVDGERGTVVNPPSVGANQELDFPFAPTITLGDVPSSNNAATAIGGTIYYMAIYDIAMTEDQVADHVTILEQSNDGPRR